MGRGVVGLSDMTGLNRSCLTAEDLGILGKSFITPEIARQANLFRVDSVEGARLVGRNGGGDYAGIVFTYVWPGEIHAREYRLRRDRPEFERRSDGTLREKGKYLSPPGRGNMFYIPPGTTPDHLSDPSVFTVFTEGEKKALALYRYFVERGERVLVIALSGVWGWRGTIGKVHDDSGARRDEKGTISDFGRIAWAGRPVHVVFDANVATNEQIRVARRELAKELTKRGATVRHVDLPQIEGVNGIDDLLAVKGPEFVTSLFYSAKPVEDVKTERSSQATALVELASEVELFHTPGGKEFATVSVNGHQATLPLKSGAFRDWLSLEFYRSRKGIPNGTSLQDAINTLAGRARFDGPQIEVYTRLASHGDIFYLDLCDESWRSVEITAGGWRVVNTSPVKFRRARGMLPLPEPERGGSLDSLRGFVNIGSDGDWTLLCA